MHIAVITSVKGLNNATIKDPQVQFDKTQDTIHYYAFVDRKHNVKVWEQMTLPNFSHTDTLYSDRRNAKYAKVLGMLQLHEYDYYIWHDAYCDIIVHPSIIIRDYLKNADFALFKHCERKCAYAEIDKCIEVNNDHKELLMDLKSFLYNERYPKDNGLFELSSFVYKNNPRVKNTMLAWWELICRYSSRDQCSFPYALMMNKAKVNILPGSALGYGGNNQIIPQVRSKYS